MFNEPGATKDKVKECFTIDLPDDYFSEGHDTYLFIAGYSGKGIAHEHLIHKIRFIDPHHLHDSEDQDSDEDQVPFSGKAKDIIRKGAMQQSD